MVADRPRDLLDFYWPRGFQSSFTLKGEPKSLRESGVEGHANTQCRQGASEGLHIFLYLIRAGGIADDNPQGPKATSENAISRYQARPLSPVLKRSARNDQQLCEIVHKATASGLFPRGTHSGETMAVARAVWAAAMESAAKLAETFTAATHPDTAKSIAAILRDNK